MKIIPVRDMVAVRREAKSIIGSLEIPEAHRDYEFYVDAIGPDVTGIEVGDRVYCDPTGKAYIPEGGDGDVGLVKLSDILAVLR